MNLHAYLFISAALFLIFGLAMLRTVLGQFDHWLNLVIPTLCIGLALWGIACATQIA